MSRFLRFCAFLSVLFFATNVFASGYTCPTYKRYTSCNSGYYLNGTSAGNSCDLCPSGCTCSGGTAQPDCSIRVTYNLNGGSGTVPSATQCTSGVSCTLQSGATTSFYRAGYVFKGWATSSTATTGSTSITVTASRTVYAVWSKCGAGTYKTSSAQASASCSSCPDGYKSGSGTTAQGNCLASCEAGYAVVSEGGACTSIQDDNHVGIYTTSHTVKYGELSTLNQCPQGYIYNLGTTAQSNCRTLCSAGYAVLSVNDRCRKIDSMQGVYTPEHFVYYGDKSEIVSCPTGYEAGNGTTAKEECIASCEAGSAVVKEHAECTSIQTNDYLGIYTEAHTVKYGALSTLTMCPDGYQDGKGAKSYFGCIASCKAGYAVLGQGALCTSIQNSTYKGKFTTYHMVNYGDTTTISTCPTNYQAGNGTTAQSNCTTSCSAGYAVLSANGACTSIQNATYKGKYITAHTVKYGGKSTISTCPTNYQAGNGTTAKSNCTTSCSAGYAVLSANGACESIMDDTAYAGQYTDDHTVKYGDKTEILVCPDGYGARLTGSESKSDCQATCPAGYAVINPGLGCVNIMNDEYTGQYTDEHNVKYEETSEIQMCPDPYRAGKGTKTISGCLVDCPAGSAVLTAGGECTSIQNSTYKGKYITAHMVNYGDTTTISTCPTNYQAGNGTTAQSNCTTSCSAGYAVLSANGACTTIQNSTYKGKYIVAHTVKYGGTSTISTCPTNYQAGNGTTAKSNCTTSCSAGYAVLSANGACESIMDDTAYAGQYTDDHTVKYGDKTEILVCPDGYGARLTGSESKSDCQTICNAGYAVLSEAGECTSIQNSTYKGKFTTYHTVNYGVTSPISTCPTNYQAGNGTTAQSNCTASCAAGTRVASAKAACSAVTSGNVYMLAHTVKYGSTSAAATSCPSGYTISGTTQSDHDAKDDCKITCSAGTRVASADASCSSISSSTGYYITGHTVSAGTTSPAATQCPANYRSGAGTTSQANCSLTTTAGKYVASPGAGETACVSPYFCPGGVIIKYGTGTTTGGYKYCTDLGTIYTKSDAGASVNTKCYATTTSKKWIASAKATAETDCTAGYYCEGGTKVYYNSTGGRAQCTAGNYCPAGSNAMSSCTSLGSFYTTSSPGATAASACSGKTTAGKFVKAANSGEETCEAGGYCPGAVSVAYGSTGGRTACPAGTKNASTGSSTASACTTCDAGTYNTTTGNASCSNCGTGYYCTGGSARTQCTSTSGWTTTTSTDKSTSHSACYQTQTPSGCASGVIKRTASSISGTTITYGSASVSTSLSAKANYYVSGTSCPVCTGLGSFYTTSAGGAINSSKCYGTTTAGKYIKTQNSSTQETCPAGSYCPATTVYYGQYDTSGGRVGCGAGKYNASTGSSASSACANITAGCYGTSASSSCPAVCGTNQYSTAGSSSCSSCPADYKNSGTTAASHAGSASCKITVSGGYYIGTAGDNSSNWDKCAGGTYKAQHTVAYGSTSSCATCSAGYYCPEGASGQTACGGNTKYSSSGASSCSTVTSGYYTTGGTATTRTGQTKCEAGNYCSGGVKAACGGGKYSSAGATSCSNITAGCYGTSASSSCPAVCGTNQYSTAGSSSCSSCPTDYKNSGTEAASHAGSASCIITVSGGYYIGTAGDNSSNWDKCAGGTYKAQHTVKYGDISSCGQCPANSYCPAGASAATACSTLASGFYPNSAAGSDAAADCKTNSLSGKYVASANATSATSCAAGTYKGAHQVNYGSTSSCGTCPANSYCTAGASAATACSTLASGFYPNSAAGSDAATDCKTNSLSGKYVASVNATSATSCAAGTYKGSHQVNYGSTSSCGTCPANSYCTAGASAATACSTLANGFYPYSVPGSDAATDCMTNILVGKYVASVNATSATSCAAGKFKGAHQVNYGSTSSCDSCALGSYSAAGASACTACQGGKTTSGTGKSSCDATCANDNSYDSTWATATWSDNAVANLCQIATCAGGSRYTSTKGEVAGTLPSGYTQLAYLESSGTQYIDTGAIADLSTQAKVKFALTDATGWPAVFGARASKTSRAFNVWASRTESIAANLSSTGATYSGIAPSLNTEYTVSLSSTHLVVNDDLKKKISGAASFTTPGHMWLFNINGGGTSTSGSSNRLMVGRVYYFQVHQDGNLVHNLIPAMRDSDGVLGMYDTVNNKFLVNAGSGKFVAGPIIFKSQNTCTQCSAGTYSAGGTATSCGTCANWTYSSAGATSCSACLSVPDAVGGVAWTKATGTGWTSYSNCVVSQTPANCASGSVKRTQSSTSAWGSTTLVSTLKSNAGYYASATATSCTICPAGSYCAANATAATGCPGSMTSNTGSDAITDCKISCDAGYMLAAGASACSACSGGYYCESGATYNYNATAVQGRTGKVTAGYYSSGGGLSATGTCLSGYSCGSCSTGTGANGRLLYSDAGAASCSECPAATGTLANRVTSYSGWWSNNIHNKVTGCYANFSDSDDTATFRTLCYYNATDGTYGGANSSCQIYAPTECAGGYYSVIESATEWYGSYAGCRGADCMKGKVCGLTDAGYYSPAGATTQTACATGSYTSATGKSACTACTAGKTTSGTGKTSCDATCDNATGAHTWATPSWSANSVSNLCTVSKCNANTYYTATTGTGYKNTCTACGSNSSTSAGNTSTTCTCTTGYTSTGGVSGATTSKSGCSLISDIACAIGEYVPASSTTCSACTAGYYCPSTAKTYSYSSSIQGRTACSAGTYQPDTGKTSCTPASKGYYVSGTAKTEQTACTGATYQNETGKTSCKSCPTGYTANTASAKIAASSCQISCAAGTQVATANAQCTTPSGNWYTTASQLVNYGSTSSVNACKVATNLFNPRDYDSLWAYISSSATTVTAYDQNAIVWVPVEPNTTYIVSGMRGANTMTMANSASVPALGVKYSNFVDPGSVGKGMLYTTSSDAKYLILMGLRIADGSTTSTRQSILDKNVANLQIFKASDGYGIIGNATTDHDAAKDCTITCGPGQYVATGGSACEKVGAGYYATGGTVAQGATSSRSQCTSPLTTIGYGTAANEVEDCGRKLHAGANVIYLRSAQRSSPSLRVKVGDTTFYGALSTSLSSPLKVKNGSTTYSVVNDWQ